MNPGGDVRERLSCKVLSALALLQFLLALSLAPRVMGEGDAAEFTLVLAVAGVPHPPGYPLYVLLGHGFVRVAHALGASWVFAALLWSTFAAAIATLLTAALCDRILPDDVRLGGPTRLALVALASGILAWNPVFLRAATQAEVHALHAAWVAASLLMSLELWRGRGQIGRRQGFSAGLLLGCGLANHLTAMLVVAPLTALLGFVIIRAAQRGRAIAVAALAGAVLPLLSYAFIAWRALHPASYQWPALEASVVGVWRHMTGAIYHGFVGAFRPSPAESRLLWTAVLPVCLPGALALVWHARHARRAPDGPVWLAWCGAVLLTSAFTLSYGVADPSAYFLPVIIVSAVALSSVFARVLQRAEHRGVALAMSCVVAAGAIFAWVPPEFAHARSITDVDRSVRAAFAALPFERGVVLWESDAHVRLLAYQQLEHIKSALIVIDPAMLTWPAYRAHITAVLGQDPLAGLTLESDADLSRVAPDLARHVSLPVADFGVWWETGPARESGMTPAH